MSAAWRLCQELNSGMELPDHEGLLAMLTRLLSPIVTPQTYLSKAASGAEAGSTPTPTSPQQDPTANCAVPAGGD